MMSAILARLHQTLELARSEVRKGRSGYSQGGDDDLHQIILSIARNPLLELRAQETQRQLALARYRSAASEDRTAAAFLEHEDVVEAIAAGRPAAAQRLVSTHIENSAKRPLSRDVEALPGADIAAPRRARSGTYPQTQR